MVNRVETNMKQRAEWAKALGQEGTRHRTWGVGQSGEFRQALFRGQELTDEPGK